MASSLVFTPPDKPVSLHNYGQWWSLVEDADWPHPHGPDSNIDGKNDHPVVQVSWEDAQAYALWNGCQLPTEAQWEWTARGGLEVPRYPWGDAPSAGPAKANIWQGDFPHNNTLGDSYYASAPVRSFPPNNFGLYDIAGNPWEWTSDWYDGRYYQVAKEQGETTDPQGPQSSYDPSEPNAPKRVLRGGSYLCHETYCESYRVSARMRASPDTGSSHVGFRTVKSVAN